MNILGSKLDAEVYTNNESVYESVQSYYGKVLQSSQDLKTTACCTAEAPPPLIREALQKVPEEISARYYGCGSALPAGITGLDVLDLGSGSGRDCYVASHLVGAQGSVTGIDMTPEQLSVARSHVPAYCQSLGYEKPNLKFIEGYIEFLDKAGLKDESFDLVISNCVVNLSPDKARVLSEVWRVLKEGGEFYFSDVYCDRRLPEAVRHHDTLLGECLGGALYIEDFKRLCHQVGFLDPRQISIAPIEITDEQLAPLVGEAQFYSITYRLFKLKDMESLCEDYGQVATYKGSISSHESGYALDDHHYFVAHKPMLVCGNTAAMVGDSWLKEHFEVIGSRARHYGLFDCSEPAATSPDMASGGCC